MEGPFLTFVHCLVFLLSSDILGEIKGLKWLFAAGGAALEALRVIIIHIERVFVLFCLFTRQADQTVLCCTDLRCSQCSTPPPPVHFIFHYVNEKQRAGRENGSHIFWNFEKCFRWWHKTMIEILRSCLCFSMVVFRIDNREETDGLFVLLVWI